MHLHVYIFPIKTTDIFSIHNHSLERNDIDVEGINYESPLDQKIGENVIDKLKFLNFQCSDSELFSWIL